MYVLCHKVCGVILRKGLRIKYSWGKIALLFFCILCQNCVGSSTSDREQRTCEANPEGDSSSFIFAVCVKSIPLYHFKLAYVVLHMAVKEFFGSPF